MSDVAFPKSCMMAVLGWMFILPINQVVTVFSFELPLTA